MTKQQRIGIAVILLTLVLILIVTVFRSGTAW